MFKREGWVKVLVLTIMVISAAGCTRSSDWPSIIRQTETSASAGEDKALTLRWFIGGAEGSTLPKAEDDFVKRIIEEKFHVKLDVQAMPIGDEYDNKISLALAGGKGPDMFVASGTISQKLAQDGLLADMTAFVSERTMPNYFRFWIDKTFDMQSYQVAGKFYRAPLPYAKHPVLAYYIRKDWLERLGMGIPKSYEDMLEAMRRFTFDDPDGNGRKDTYGFTATGNGKEIPYDFPQWRRHGFYSSDYVRDGQYHDTKTDLAITKVIDDILALNAEGIVDPDWYLNKGMQAQTRAIQGQVGIMYSDDPAFALESVSGSVQNRTKAINPKADWVPFNPFPDQPIWVENDAGYPFLFNKQTADEHPDKIRKSVEILDWLAGEEGYLLTHYGVKDKHYVLEEKRVSLNREAYNRDILRKGNFLAIYDFFTPSSPEIFGLSVLDPDMTERDLEIEERLRTGFAYAPSLGANLTPPAGVNIGEMRSKMSEYHSAMLFEEKSSRNWSTYRMELLTRYKGKDTFEAYADKVGKAKGERVVFDAGF